MRSLINNYVVIKKLALVLILVCLTSCQKTEEPQSADKPIEKTIEHVTSEVSNKYATLQDAIWENDYKAAEALIATGADVNERTGNEGWTQLHYAAHQGSLDIVKLLCEHGADVNLVSKTPEDSNYIDEEISPLFAAVMGGNIPVVQYLVEHGAEIKTSANDGTTLLHLAVRGQNVPLTKYLLSLGSAITDHMNYRTAHRYDSECPLTLASHDNHKELMMLLITHGADVNARRAGGTTILTDAISNNDLAFIKYLLERGADVNAIDDGGRTVLHYVGGNIQAAQLLLDHGALIDENAWGCDGDYSFCGSPLMVATQAGNVDMVKFLLSKGANLSVRDECMEETALDIAKKNGNAQLVELLTQAAQSKQTQVA